MKVAVIGAGIAGLAAAYDLQRAGGIEVTLFERGPTLGGKILTVREGEFLIELCPDSVFTTKPWATDLIRELGMEEDLIEPIGGGFSVLTGGVLHRVPRALAGFDLAAPGALEGADFLDAAAKKRALEEAEIPAAGRDDESIASFFSRRFGSEFSKLVAQPLLAGSHAGDPDELSVAALYPAYVGMERSHGSISKAVAERAKEDLKPGFLTLREGMGALPERVAAACAEVRILTSTAVSRLEGQGVSIIVRTSSGGEAFDQAILAIPAFAAATLLGGIAPESAENLSNIRFVSVAIATFAFPRNAFPGEVTGNGFIVPAGEPTPIAGCTFSSNKWTGRAPEDVLLLRVFLGRDHALDVDQHSDRELIDLALEGLSSLLGAKSGPLLTRLDRWPRSMPQYEFGHLKRLAAIEEALADLPVTLAGCSYRGNSVSDCVRQGREAARKLISGRA